MIDQVFSIGLNIVRDIQDTQSTNIEKAAKLISDSFRDHHKFFVTGSGHSHTVSEEFYGRAGGLAFVTPILTGELTLNEHPTKSSQIERLPGYAAILADLYRIALGDVVLIASNSGRNAYPIEMALEAKNRGAMVIAITNMKHAMATTSRHASNKHLHNIADVVIDNCGIVGDSALQLPGMQAAMCPTSSIANAFIVQAITVQCADYLLQDGIEPPVFVSLNSEGTEHVNDELFNRYTRQY